MKGKTSADHGQIHCVAGLPGEQKIDHLMNDGIATFPGLTRGGPQVGLSRLLRPIQQGFPTAGSFSKTSNAAPATFLP